MFQNLKNLASIMRQAQQMGGKMQGMGDELKNKRAKGSAGGGMVEVEVNGLGEMLTIKLDPDLVARGEREMLEDLIPAAVNQANARAKQFHMEAMQGMTAGMDVPGLQNALSQMVGGDVDLELEVDMDEFEEEFGEEEDK